MVYDQLTDIQLWDLTKENNQRAFDQIYARYAPELINHGYNKFRDREQAKDVMQDIFLKLWDNRDTQLFNTTLKQFLYVSIRNAFLNTLQREKVKSKYMESLLYFANSESLHADHLICEKELAQQIEKDVLALPQKMREVFNLRRHYHLSYREIAELQGISVQTVNQHLSKARSILGKKYGFFICLLYLI